MSGVVYALLGFVMVSHKLSPHPLTAVPAGVIGFMLFWLVLCMTGAIDIFLGGGGVANAAHLGGLIAGCLFAFIRNLKPTRIS
jgi:GlpG protein